jgi:hypothetical protein
LYGAKVFYPESLASIKVKKGVWWYEEIRKIRV